MKKLKKQRRLVGLTQHVLARLTGISATRLAYAETGRLTLTPEELQRISEVITKRAAETAANLARTAELQQSVVAGQ